MVSKIARTHIAIEYRWIVEKILRMAGNSWLRCLQNTGMLLLEELATEYGRQKYLLIRGL